MAATSSIKLLNTIEWSKKFNFSRSSAIGNFAEPALTNANTVLQTILGAPFAWWWNRVMVGFICTAGQQDYTLFNYQASTAVKIGWYVVDDAGNSQQCTTAGITGTTSPTWSHTKGGVTTDGSVTWTNIGSLGNPEVKGTYTFSWIETASVQNVSNTDNRWMELETKQMLALEESTSRPRYIAGQLTDGNGNITFRVSAVPDKAYPIILTLQQKAPLFTSTQQTWSPIPDEFSHIYNWGFLSLQWLFADDPRFQLGNAKFVTALLGANQGLSQTQINIFLQNWQYVTGQPMSNQSVLAQGQQARAQ